MNILLISHFYPPLRIGGAEKIAQAYAVEFQKLGNHVQVLCAGDWETGKQHWNGFTDETNQGVAVRRINLNWTLASDPNRCLYDNPIVEAYLDKWIDEWKPDIVHIVSLITLSASVIRVAKKHSLPIVFTLVDFWSICPKNILLHGDQTMCNGITTSVDCLRCLMWDTKAYSAMERFLGNKFSGILLPWLSEWKQIANMRGLRGRALNIKERKNILAEMISMIDQVTAPSAFLGKIIVESGINPGPIPVISYGHDLSWLDKMPEKSRANVVRFCYIGQIIPIKGLHIMIRAFKQAGLADRAQLQIYGNADSNPEYTAVLKEMIQPTDQINFMGGYLHHQLGEILSKIDVVIVPSQWHENNPLVIQEAFACKTPVIASNVGGISEFVQHRVNGLLFRNDSIEELSDQIQAIVQDPDLVNRLAMGIKSVKTLAEEVAEYNTIYKRLIAQSL